MHPVEAMGSNMVGLKLQRLAIQLSAYQARHLLNRIFVHVCLTTAIVVMRGVASYASVKIGAVFNEV